MGPMRRIDRRIGPRIRLIRVEALSSSITHAAMSGSASPGIHALASLSTAGETGPTVVALRAVADRRSRRAILVDFVPWFAGLGFMADGPRKSRPRHGGDEPCHGWDAIGDAMPGRILRCRAQQDPTSPGGVLSFCWCCRKPLGAAEQTRGNDHNRFHYRPPLNLLLDLRPDAVDLRKGQDTRLPSLVAICSRSGAS